MNDKSPTYPQTVIISYAALAACLPFASKDKTRAYLTGVYVHCLEGKTAYVATNGHKLCLAEPATHISAETATPGHEGFIIQREDVEALILWNDKKSEFDGARYGYVQIAENGHLTFKSWDGKLVRESKAIDASYPDYQRVIPKPDAKLVAEPVGLDASMLADILKVAKAGFSHRRVHSCVGHFYGASNATKWTIKNPDQDKATVIIMAMRV